jgi:hypothetical protein
MAVNVTEVPSQIVPEGNALMLTLAGCNALTVMVMALEVAGLPETHVSFDVITTVIISPFASVVVV